MWWFVLDGFHMHDGFGWGWMAFGMVWMVVFWGAIIGLVVWGISKLDRGREEAPRERSALEIARERYARGELSREEFQQLREDLREGQG